MKLNLIRRKEEVPGVESFIFNPAEPIEWKAGQYFHFVLHHEPTDNRGSDRYFTVASAPFEKEVMITTRLTKENGSTFKNALNNLKIGKAIEISNVTGNFVVENTEAEYVFIAGGIGITPFHSILKQADHEGKELKVTLLYSNRDENIPYKEELEKLKENNPNLKIHYLVASERLDENSIKELSKDMKDPIYYISGPEPMVESLGNKLKESGIPDEKIKQDWFPGYVAE